MLRKGNEIWVAHHMLPGTAEVTCPRPRGDGAGCHAYPCQAELPRIHADNCSAPLQVDFQDCGAVAIPTLWIVACTVCPQPTQIGSYFRVLHQRSSGSEPCVVSVIRALRSALHILYLMVRGCCAAKTQQTTRRRLRMLQRRHRPGLSPPLWRPESRIDGQTWTASKNDGGSTVLLVRHRHVHHWWTAVRRGQRRSGASKAFG